MKYRSSCSGCFLELPDGVCITEWYKKKKNTVNRQGRLLFLTLQLSLTQSKIRREYTANILIFNNAVWLLFAETISHLVCKDFKLLLDVVQHSYLSLTSPSTQMFQHVDRTLKSLLCFCQTVEKFASPMTQTNDPTGFLNSPVIIVKRELFSKNAKEWN